MGARKGPKLPLYIRNVGMTEAINTATFSSLMKAANITPARWSKWYTDAGGTVGDDFQPDSVVDTEAMKARIVTHVQR